MGIMGIFYKTIVCLYLLQFLIMEQWFINNAAATAKSQHISLNEWISRAIAQAAQQAF